MSRRHKTLVALVLVAGFAGGWWLRAQQPLAHSQAGAQEKAVPAVPADDGKLRIIAFGAHPDDCELKAGGVAAKWAAQGHHVKFVSVTNGDVGHWQIAGGPLARRRLEEVQKAARILGIHTQVLDIHDGELEPTLEHRRTITRLIRQWKADIVLAHRPNDYHPDHRYTGILVQDAAYMVTVPFFCPDVPYLQNNPVFLYYSDRFERPNPFRPDLVVDLDDVIEKKLAALDVLESQFLEGGCNGGPHLMPKDAAGREERRRKVRQAFADRSLGIAKKYRAKLVELYGQERGSKVQHAEAFELCEYGNQPSKAELRKLFPFFGEIKKTAGASAHGEFVVSAGGQDSPAAKPQAAAARRVKQIIAHRGSSADCPENTLASYRRAIEAGATANEMDVRTTRDGVLISLHDADVRRTSNGKGLVSELTLAELRKLDAGGWFDPKFKDERIPTMQEILALCRGKVDVLLDLKETGEDYATRVTAEVRKYGDPKRTIVGVRSVEQAKLFRKLLPEARQIGLIPTPESLDAFAAAKVETVRVWPKWLSDKALVPRVRQHKLQLHLNGTTGAEEEVRSLLRYEPDSLSSDDPGRLVQTLARIVEKKSP